MIVSETSPQASSPALTSGEGKLVRKISRSSWMRIIVACGFLLISGGIRFWQANRVDAALQLGKQSPFPLDTLPIDLKSWKGQTTQMDEQLVRATGSTDRITRHYVDQRTGVSLDVIVLYGPTSDMFIHAPELCYPKAGYQSFGVTKERSIPLGKRSVPFRSLAYTKGEGGQTEIQEVYYSWRYNGRWHTTVQSHKQSERIPGMYKVQVARRISAKESRDFDNPAEAFIELLVAEMERRISGGVSVSSTAS